MITVRGDIRAVARDPAARSIVRGWRDLTGGSAVRDGDRRTLVACSGGADSAGLLLALASATDALAVGHVVHDMRPAEETRPERAAVRELAGSLGLPFVGGYAGARGERGNAEANARRARYRELEGMAIESGCPFVATAHHAEDQLESVVMALVRGAGPRALGGMRDRRRLGDRGVQLVRPMLGVTRADAERLCGLAGVAFVTDPTNSDPGRLRAAIRGMPLGKVLERRASGYGGLRESARHLREVGDLVERLAAGLLAEAGRSEGELRWERERLGRAEPLLVGAALRGAYAELLGGRHMDGLSARSVRRVVEAIAGGDRGERRFVWKGAEVVVDAGSVAIRREVSGG